MKRSQMVERIYDLLNCDGVLEYSMPKLEPVPLTESHIRWIANIILEDLEQAGMLPPEVFHTWESGHGSGVKSLGNKWELEDETKSNG